jgi:D-alanyl-D-alanine carboxypeptidase
VKKLSALVVALLLLNIQPTHAVETLPQPFFNYLNSKYLGNPGVILIDKASGEVIYESGSTKARTPASVLKLTTAAAIALTLDASTVFKTAIYKTEKRGVFVIWGENDPWITSNAKTLDIKGEKLHPYRSVAAWYCYQAVHESRGLDY